MLGHKSLLDSWGREVLESGLTVIRVEDHLDARFLLEVRVIPVVTGADLEFDRDGAERIRMKRFDLAVPEVLMQFGPMPGELI
jgi:hypothetical protein